MGRNVEEIEQQVAQLSSNELRQFRAWYEKFDSEIWDEQIEDDVKAGRLETFASEAIADHEAGKSTPL